MNGEGIVAAGPAGLRFSAGHRSVRDSSLDPHSRSSLPRSSGLMLWAEGSHVAMLLTLKQGLSRTRSRSCFRVKRAQTALPLLFGVIHGTWFIKTEEVYPQNRNPGEDGRVHVVGSGMKRNSVRHHRVGKTRLRRPVSGGNGLLGPAGTPEWGRGGMPSVSTFSFDFSLFEAKMTSKQATLSSFKRACVERVS